MLSHLRNCFVVIPYSSANWLFVLAHILHISVEVVLWVVFAYVCTSYYTLMRAMAFEYDRFAVVLRIEILFISYPVLKGAVVA